MLSTLLVKTKCSKKNFFSFYIYFYPKEKEKTNYWARQGLQNGIQLYGKNMTLILLVFDTHYLIGSWPIIPFHRSVYHAYFPQGIEDSIFSPYSLVSFCRSRRALAVVKNGNIWSKLSDKNRSYTKRRWMEHLLWTD
jgi:hypothetical protein